MHTVEALDSLILFRQKPDSLLRRLMATEEAVRVAAQGELVALAVENGWQGDLWRCCIAWTLTEHENPFSLSWERRTGPEDTDRIDLQLFQYFHTGSACHIQLTDRKRPHLLPDLIREKGMRLIRFFKV